MRERGGSTGTTERSLSLSLSLSLSPGRVVSRFGARKMVEWSCFRRRSDCARARVRWLATRGRAAGVGSVVGLLSVNQGKGREREMRARALSLLRRQAGFVVEKADWCACGTQAERVGLCASE
jgi:hypothetical protein